MAYSTKKTTLSLGRLYRVSQAAINPSKTGGNFGPYLTVLPTSSTVNIYGAATTGTAPSALTGMALNTENTGLTGLITLGQIPEYIAIVQNASTTTSIVSWGLEVEDLGAIS